MVNQYLAADGLFGIPRRRFISTLYLSLVYLRWVPRMSAGCPQTRTTLDPGEHSVSDGSAMGFGNGFGFWVGGSGNGKGIPDGRRSVSRLSHDRVSRSSPAGISVSGYQYPTEHFT